jgi:hypothetical protein
MNDFTISIRRSCPRVIGSLVNMIRMKVALKRFKYRPPDSSEDLYNIPHITMAHSVPPDVSPLRKLTDWLLGLYNASAHAPAVPLHGGSAIGEAQLPNSFPLPTLSLLVKGILLCLLVTFVVSYARSSRQRLPPQPRGLPIIGNFFQLANRRWLYSRECKESFGEYQALT